MTEPEKSPSASTQTELTGYARVLAEVGYSPEEVQKKVRPTHEPPEQAAVEPEVIPS